MTTTPMQKLVIGNWKMSVSPRAAEAFVRVFARMYQPQKNVAVVVCPSFVSLSALHPLTHHGIALGAQDVFWEKEGAYTGAVSARDLRESGCDYVLLGHSERRRYFHETDAMVRKKLAAVLATSLTPVLCVGETAHERRSGKQNTVVLTQMRRALEGLATKKHTLCIAYEPVWAIGTGKTVTPKAAEAMMHVIKKYCVTRAKKLFMLYGGSVNAANVAGFTMQHSIDGVLVGTASVAASSFASIIRAVGGK